MPNDTELKATENIFPWNKYFEVGVEDIDRQHAELVQILNEFCSLSLSGKADDEQIASLFDALIDYTRYHFESEEAYYEKHELPRKLQNNHAQLHRNLVTTVLLLRSQYENKDEHSHNLEEILTKLVIWLSNHILEEDTYAVLIIRHMQQGLDARKATARATEAMQGPRRDVVNIIKSMVNISSASMLELKRELELRLRIENQLRQEILTRKQIEEELRLQVDKDGMTGLLNRRGFSKLGERILHLSRQNQHKNSMLFIDIDGFKRVNDSFGHEAGDDVLVEIAQRLRKLVRKSDIIARFGGDEFLIYLTNDCSIDHARQIAEKITQDLSVPIEIESGTVEVGSSIGISTFPSDSESFDTLIQQADQAMYEAKRAGRGTYRAYAELGSG